MNANDKLKEIRGKHPYPWREVIHPNGVVQMIDAAGKEVGLFEMTAFMAIITLSWATQESRGAA